MDIKIKNTFIAMLVLLTANVTYADTAAETRLDNAKQVLFFIAKKDGAALGVVEGRELGFVQDFAKAGLDNSEQLLAHGGNCQQMHDMFDQHVVKPAMANKNMPLDMAEAAKRMMEAMAEVTDASCAVQQYHVQLIH